MREVVRFKYRAFISYSRFDKQLAHRLQQKLESYRIPRGLEKFGSSRGTNNKEARKLGRIFMDYDELAASSELGPALNGALDDSENLIVIASRIAANSKWVDKEIAYFRKHSSRPVLALIASGTPNDPGNECFPPELRALDASRQPLAPNLQDESFPRSFIRLVAAIIGVSFDTLWQRERRRLRQNIALACVVILSFTVIIIAPTLIMWDRYDRERSVDKLISQTEAESANSEYERAIKTALEGLPVSKDAPWALSWSNAHVKKLASKLAGAAQLSSVSGGAAESGTVTAVSFSPNGQRILTSSEAGTATIWDAHSFSLVARCFGDQIIADKLRVLSRTPDGAFKPGLSWIRDSRFSYDGTRVVSSGYFGTAWIWSVEQGKCVAGPILLGHLSDVRTAAFSRDGSRVVTTSDDCTIRIWDAASGQFIRAIGLPVSRKNGTYTTDAEFASDDNSIVLSTSAGLIAIADPLSGVIQVRLQESGANVRNVNYSSDGKRVVSASEDGSVVIWNIGTGQKVRLERQDQSVNHAAFGPGDSLIVTASSDGTASVWDANELGRKGIFRGHSRSVTSAAFSPDGRTIITGSADRTFRTWDLTRSVIPPTVAAHTDAIVSASMSRNQSYFVTGGADGNVILWGLETPNGTLKKLSQGTVEKGAITGVAYGPHEILVATSVGDISAWRWDRADSNPILTPRSLDVHVIPSERGKPSVTVSDDGRFIAAGSDYDDKARTNNRVWGVATGRSWPLEEGTRIVSLEFGNNYLARSMHESWRV
jgi:WD40 repeat protein